MEESSNVGWMVNFFDNIGNSLIRLQNKIKEINKQFQILEDSNQIAIPETFNRLESLLVNASTTDFHQVYCVGLQLVISCNV